MNFEVQRVENKEQFKRNIVVVDFIRHGETEYLEDVFSDEEKLQMGSKYPRDLTPEGERQVRENAKIVVDNIDPDNEIVILWSSPAWRAQGAEEIIQELLGERGIEVYKKSTISTMRSFDQKDQEYMDNLWEELADNGKIDDAVYERDPMFQQKSDRFESQPEVIKRVGRFFNSIRYFVEHADLSGKKLHIIGVSHFEFLNPLMEDIFDFRVDDDEGIKKGEDITITFDYDKDSEEMVISADFRGAHKDGIVFDKKIRKFIIKK